MKIITFLVLSLCLMFVGISAAGNGILQDCTGGKLSANLTGWSLNDMMPRGSASFDSAAGRLDVTVEMVGLSDGTKLHIFNGDRKVGDLDALKDGKASVSLTGVKLDPSERVRVTGDERPIVSGKLICAADK